MTTRDDILDALETLLLEGGTSATTFEAVAARAGISKGGLLYHFRTKEALYEGFLTRLREGAIAEVEAARVAPEGLVRAYLDLSTVADNPSTRTILAALRLVGVQEVDVEAALADSFDSWYTILAEQIDDPILARLIQLVGDGLYLHALIGSTHPDADAEVVAAVVGVVVGAFSSTGDMHQLGMDTSFTVAPVGSAKVAMRPNGESSGWPTTVPPSSDTRARVASTSFEPK